MAEMTTINIIQVTMELVCCTILLVPLGAIVTGDSPRNQRGKWIRLYLLMDILLLLADSMAYIFRGNMTQAGLVMTRVSNFGVFFLEYILLICLGGYIKAVVEETGGTCSKYFSKVLKWIAWIGIVLLVISRVTGLYYTFDATNHYVRGKGLLINFVLHGLGVLWESIEVVRQRRQIGPKYYFSLLLYFILTVGSFVLQGFLYGLSLGNLAVTLALLIMYFIFEREMQAENKKQMELIAQQERRLMEARQRILLSAVQPHFLFNSLDAIEELVEEDPQQAIQLVEDLAGFLRESIDTLNTPGTISIHKEIKSVKHYMTNMEIRFGGKVVCELDEPAAGIDYQIPPFTLQPLVENAIKHGIRKKETGRGTVTVSFAEEADAHYIRVADDGVGFIRNQKTSNDGHVHMGMDIVEERLSSMCRGTLKIESCPGKGTVCEIRIPER